jgi:hypothetical protein
VTFAGVVPLRGLPTEVDVPGHGKVKFGPLPEARVLAQAYTKSAGLPYNPVQTYRSVDPARAGRIATAYDAMAHAPNDPKVRAAYDAMIAETIAQYQLIKQTGLKIELITSNMVDPYFKSPRLAIMDVVSNNHLWVFPSKIGFGSPQGSASPNENLLMADTSEQIGSDFLCVNDIFRIVHDYFGHIKEGIGFRADGEENAWRCHAAMYSRLALGAITSELRGQNSWLNYGPNGFKNRTANTADTIYAVQKNGLLPEWIWDEGRQDV